VAGRYKADVCASQQDVRDNFHGKSGEPLRPTLWALDREADSEFSHSLSINPRLCSAKVREKMLALLEWAADHPKSWYDLGNLPETMKAAELLEKRGVIEIASHSNQYRIKPKN
jgi:hypothetical protein